MPSVTTSTNHSDTVSQRRAVALDEDQRRDREAAAGAIVMKFAGVASASVPNRFVIDCIGDVTAPPPMRARGAAIEVGPDRAGDRAR